MENILITGAGGFIGGFMVEKALQEGFKTWAGVRKTTNRRYLQQSELSFIDLPFHDKEALKQELLKQKELGIYWNVIIHNLGATKCIHASDFDKINYQYTRNFVEALIKSDMVPQQFIMMSSLSALGPGDEKGMTPIFRDDNPTPNTAYGVSKLKTEQFLKGLADFPWTIMRPTGVYGPREKDYFLMVQSVKKGFDFKAGFKPQQITFIYVKDLVDCVFCAIRKKAIHKSYLVSEGRAYSSSDFRKYIQHEIGKKVVIALPVPLFLLKGISAVSQWVAALLGKSATLNLDKYKIMKQRNWICDITPLKEELDFTPHYSLKKGVAETIQWYKENHWI